MPESAPSALRPSVTVATPVAALAAAVGARLIGDDAVVRGVVVHGVEQRSDAVQAGDLFAALPGAKAHGATFAAAAVQAGAVAVLTDEEGADIARALGVPVLLHSAPRAVLGEVSGTVYGHPSRHMQVIGVTGTSGKTTTTYLIEAALEAAGRTPGLIGTIETRIRRQRIPSALTTPEAPQLHALFALMREQGADCVVMEVSSHALALGRVDGVRFDVGAFTNLSQDHLDFHPTIDDYFAAKVRLFDPTSAVHAAHAVICVDDEWGRKMADLTADPVITVATTTTEADWTTADLVARDDGGQEFVIHPPAAAPIPARLGLPGPYNVANALLAVATCAAAGVDPHVAAAALADVAVPGRVQRIDRGQPFLAIVDYAHKPAALEAVIATLRAHAKGRIGVVVGAGGDRDTGKRAVMGMVGARAAELLVITDDNPRSEDPAAIRAAILAGANAVPDAERGEVREIGDRAAAIAAAVAWAKPGDVVLVAGKGHETGQETAGVKHPFDDREVLARAIQNNRGEP